MSRRMERIRLPGLVIALAAIAASMSAARADVYVHTGEHGEISFTDQAVPGAERVTLDPVDPPANAPEQSALRVQQTLEVARALEASRLARETARAKARADARAAQARSAAPPEVIRQDHYLRDPYGFASPYDRRRYERERFHDRGRFRGRHDKYPHDRHERSAERRTISKPFPYDPD